MSYVIQNQVIARSETTGSDGITTIVEHQVHAAGKKFKVCYSCTVVVLLNQC